ncbi:hypothetical protein B0H16DRAFT_25759 [Mycena metata]|uniref:Uncharacterized protein n=1 Tax=Mycena metata TaxID=1033252 RepID=A0AAD7KI71_9AGAR|nr:hypothetical protein B0H16DRAFT_25759 [Mycena metata]
MSVTVLGPPPLKTPTAPDSASSTPIPPVKTTTTPDSALSTPLPPVKAPTAPDSVPTTTTDSASSTPIPPVKTTTTPDSALSTPLPPVKAPTAPDSVPTTTTMSSSSAKSAPDDALNSSSSASPSHALVTSSSSSKSSAAVKTSGRSTDASPASPIGHSSSADPASSPASPPPTSPIHQQVSFTGTITSTITDPPSTLAKPSFISVLESNGKITFTAPPLVTILSSSREPNGSFVTFTHVVANPTGFSQAISGGHASFFSNAGAVAGVFLVVGGILTAIAAFGIFIMCRRRRRKRERHRRWLISINRPRSVMDDPFQSPRSAPNPPIRVVPPEWDTEHRQEMSESGLGLYNVPQREQAEEQHGQYAEPQHFEQLQAYYDGANLPHQNIGLAISTDVNRSKPSLAQSSPSVYPPSLPPANDDRLVEEAPPPQRRYSSDASVAPPRPRRSHLREPSKGPLITPPSSVSSHSPVSEFGGPFGFTSLDSDRAPVQPGSPQLNEIMGRRTLLDVRPRSRDNNQ